MEFSSLPVPIYIALIDDNIINGTDPVEQNLIDCWNFKFGDEAHYWDMHRLMTMIVAVVMLLKRTKSCLKSKIQVFYNTQRLQMKKFIWENNEKWKQRRMQWENVHDDDDEVVANRKIDALRWILMEIINAIKGDYGYISESFHKYL